MVLLPPVCQGLAWSSETARAVIAFVSSWRLPKRQRKLFDHDCRTPAGRRRLCCRPPQGVRCGMHPSIVIASGGSGLGLGISLPKRLALRDAAIFFCEKRPEGRMSRDYICINSLRLNAQVPTGFVNLDWVSPALPRCSRMISRRN